MRLADPVHNVELRKNAHGHDSVVFSFPYRADIVDAVRAIPGRRFDWQTKEWWAPRADATPAYVQGVLERFPELDVAPEGSEWLAPAGEGWGGRVAAARRARPGWVLGGGPAGAARGGGGSCSPASRAGCRGSCAGTRGGGGSEPGCRSSRGSPSSCWSSPARGSTPARCAARRGCRWASSRRPPRWR